jgi:hypothetical protein
MKLRRTATSRQSIQSEQQSFPSATAPRLDGSQPSKLSRSSSPSLTQTSIAPRLLWKPESPPRLLIFDIENRPLSYWYDGNPTAEVSIISAKWLDEGEPFVFTMKRGGNSRILQQFRPLYDAADVVVGHHIRGHDLPILNGAYIEQGMEPLAPKMTIDTLKDLIRWKDIPKSLEYLAAWLGCPIQKPHLTQHDWRKANRLDDGALKIAEMRCRDDVLATEWVYKELMRKGLINKPPRRWTP